MVAIAAFAFPPHYEGNLQLTGDATGLGTNSFTNSLAFKTAANGSMTSSNVTGTNLAATSSITLQGTNILTLIGSGGGGSVVTNPFASKGIINTGSVTNSGSLTNGGAVTNGGATVLQSTLAVKGTSSLDNGTIATSGSGDQTNNSFNLGYGLGGSVWWRIATSPTTDAVDFSSSGFPFVFGPDFQTNGTYVVTMPTASQKALLLTQTSTNDPVLRANLFSGAGGLYEGIDVDGHSTGSQDFLSWEQDVYNDHMTIIGTGAIQTSGGYQYGISNVTTSGNVFSFREQNIVFDAHSVGQTNYLAAVTNTLWPGAWVYGTEQNWWFPADVRTSIAGSTNYGIHFKLVRSDSSANLCCIIVPGSLANTNGVAIGTEGTSIYLKPAGTFGSIRELEMDWSNGIATVVVSDYAGGPNIPTTNLTGNLATANFNSGTGAVATAAWMGNGQWNDITNLFASGTIASNVMYLLAGLAVTNLTQPSTSFIATNIATTKGDIGVFNGTNWTRIGAGTDGYYLGASNATATGLAYFQLPAGGSGVATLNGASTNQYLTNATTSGESATNFTLASNIQFLNGSTINGQSVIPFTNQNLHSVVYGTWATNIGGMKITTNAGCFDSFQMPVFFLTNASPSSSGILIATYTFGAAYQNAPVACFTEQGSTSHDNSFRGSALELITTTTNMKVQLSGASPSAISANVNFTNGICLFGY